jgi:hypothetical protein
MPYRVIVERKNGTQSSLLQIHNKVTPQIGTTIEIEIEGIIVQAVVTNVTTYPPKVGGIAVSTTDSVTAKEI